MAAVSKNEPQEVIQELFNRSAKANAIRDDLKLDLSHSLTDAVQNADASYQLAKTAAMQSLSAKRQVDTLRSQFE